MFELKYFNVTSSVPKNIKSPIVILSPTCIPKIGIDVIKPTIIDTSKDIM